MNAQQYIPFRERTDNTRMGRSYKQLWSSVKTKDLTVSITRCVTEIRLGQVIQQESWDFFAVVGDQVFSKHCTEKDDIMNFIHVLGLEIDYQERSYGMLTWVELHRKTA